MLDLIEFLQCKLAPLGRFKQVGESADGHHDVILRRVLCLSHAGNQEVDDVAAAGFHVCSCLRGDGEEAQQVEAGEAGGVGPG